MPADYHTHTPLCRHAEGEPEEYVDAAIAAGVTEFGLSDHAPVGTGEFDDWRMLFDELPDYYERIERARGHSAGRIPVRAGLECDWLEGCEKWIEKLASDYSWDYLIGSVHYLGDWDFDNPKWLDRWSATDVDAAWTEYWDTYTEMAQSELFDILGHPDLIKKFSRLPQGDLRRFYDPAIEAIANSNQVIEINTAGWHKPCEDAYPSAEFLELARGAGIPLVISSDAHAPQQVGRDFSRAIALAKECGYSETVLFQQRKKRYENL